MTRLSDGLRQLMAGRAPDGSPVATYRCDAQGLGRATDSYYAPCDTGLHLCGQTDDGQQPTTVGNWPMEAASARAMFLWIVQNAPESPAEADDYVLDLQIAGDTEDDITLSRHALQFAEAHHP